MIKIAGAVAEVVPLPDLGDRVYYKQEKVYSEAEFHKSNDLKREIQRGRLRVLAREDEKFSEYKIPVSKNIPHINNKDSKDKSSTELISHIQNIEKKISEKSQGNNENLLLEKLFNRIEQLEGKITQIGSVDNQKITDLISKLESQTKTPDNNDIINRLEKIIARAPQLRQEDKSIKKLDEEVYVPKIKVEDGTSHIKLKTRTVEKSDNVNSALEALKKLKKKK